MNGKDENEHANTKKNLGIRIGFVIFNLICISLLITFGYLGLTGGMATWIWMLLNLSILTILLIVLMLYMLKFHVKN